MNQVRKTRDRMFSISIHALRRMALVVLLAVPLAVSAAGPKFFATPDEAVNALLAALKADDDAAILTIFGDKHAEVVISPDKAANSESRAKFAAEMQIFRLLEERGKDRRILLIGAQAWPLPIPLVNKGGRWFFATDEGVDELVSRRIGANERSAIEVMRAYLDAQREYASRDRNGDGVLEYAQRLGSTAGKRDGLYWEADATKGEEMSPFGPLVAESAAYLKGRRAGDPYRGYHFHASISALSSGSRCRSAVSSSGSSRSRQRSVSQKAMACKARRWAVAGSAAR